MTNAMLTRRISRNTHPLSEYDLRKYAPSIFAEHAHEDRGKSYKFFNSYELVRSLMNQGWEPIQAMESNTRIESRQGYLKHMIRFRRLGDDTRLINVGDTIFNLVFVNSHDASSSYQLHAGLLRLACTNGMIVSDRAFEPVRLRHAKLETEDVIDAQFRVLNELPVIGEQVRQFQAIELKPDERVEFARAALQLRWDNDESGKSTAPIRAEQLLSIMRPQDTRPDLYTTMNVVQEHLVRGGVSGRNSGGNNTTTRAVTGVDGNIKLNKAIWALTEAMASLKS